MESTLGVKYGLILALRIQIFEYLGDFFRRHALERLKSAHPFRKK